MRRLRARIFISEAVVLHFTNKFSRSGNRYCGCLVLISRMQYTNFVWDCSDFDATNLYLAKIFFHGPADFETYLSTIGLKKPSILSFLAKT
jgi:hypothetical protein